MAYIKNTWFDQNVEKPKTYNVIRNTDGSVTLVDNFGQITELGTPVNAENMNHIEDGVAGVAIRLFSMDEIFALDEWVKDGEKLFKSLQDQNQGHATSEAEFWEEVKLGGGGGTHYPTEIFSMICDDNYTPEGASKLNGQEFGADMFLETWNNYLTDTTDIVRAKVCTYEEYAQELATNGYVLKFAVDKIARTFKVPTATDEQMSAIWDNAVGVKGNGLSLGIDNGVEKMTLWSAPNYGLVTSGSYGSNVGSEPTSPNNPHNRNIGVTKETEKSGLITDTTTAKRPQRHFFVYLANAEIGDFTVNYNEMMSALGGKLNTDGSNATQQDKEAISTWGIPNYNNPIATNVALPDGYTPFTASKNCYIYCQAVDGERPAISIHRQNNGAPEGIISFHSSSLSNSYTQALAFIAKGQTVYIRRLHAGSGFYNVYPLFESKV